MKRVLWISLLALSVLPAQTAEELVSTNGCLACHATHGQKSAPAFAGIARRNQKQNGDSAKDTIMNSIKNGSSGKYRNFSDTKMPPYPSISDSDLAVLAEYILAQKPTAKGNGNGKGHGGQNRDRMRQGMGHQKGNR